MSLRLGAVSCALATLLLCACGSAPPRATPTPVQPEASPTRTLAPLATPRPTSEPLSVALPTPTRPARVTPTIARLATPQAAPSPTAAAVGGVEPIAVMVDNIAEARPQSGLGTADVVYEAPAEGGIPRLMPIYFHAGPGRVGPVRSARHYFVYLAAEYGAALVHVGASPQGFQALSETGLVNVDEIEGAAGFSRDPRRAPPHNAYINLPTLRDALIRQGTDPDGTLGGLHFGLDAAPAGGQPASTLEIDFPGGARYVCQYAYDPASRTYPRSMDGSPHRDAETGERYAARAVIVERVAAPAIPGDDAGRLDVEVTGSGDGLLALDGQAYPITWARSDVTHPTSYAYANGAPVVLPQGQVWIELAPRDANVVTR